MQTMIETSATRSAMYRLGPVGRIPLGEGQVFRVSGVDVAIYRARDGQVFATQAFCPHQGGPLADGILGDGKVVCPLHAYRFDLATGQPLGNGCEPLQTYRAFVDRNGELWLEVDQDGQ